tara:strand:+ start:8435 stop:8623 length:189 start_codon:yes stop_codon:yes gene_type:complete
MGTDINYCPNGCKKPSYKGYKWIKVKREESVLIDGIKYVTEKHHVEETTFLINEIRKLANEL